VGRGEDEGAGAGKGDLEGAQCVWAEYTVGGHVPLEFDRMDEYFLGGRRELKRPDTR